MNTNSNQEMLEHSGFVSIIGKPNAGKSTLLNAILGERLSIITHKAQTTRHRIQGILSGPDFQMVFSDTPGTLTPAHKLHERMMNYVNESFKDADVFVYVVDVTEPIEEDEYILRLQKVKSPIIVVLNKMDLSTPEHILTYSQTMQNMLNPKHIISISALKNFMVDGLVSQVKALLPKGPSYYDSEQLTDKSERFIAAEMIREQILTTYKEEVPYNVEVVIDSFKDNKNLLRIEAIIYVMRDSQKAIMIGQGGMKLKQIGTRARKNMEKFWDKKVFLQTFVKVKENWRDDDLLLNQFGYE